MVNFVQSNISSHNSNRYNITNNYISRSHMLRTNVKQNDVFFRGLSKTYNLAKANKQEDIPDDANIFLFNCKTKVHLPEGRSAKECILTDKGFGFWAKFFGGEEANKMLLKKNDVEYAHGDLTGDRRTCGLIEVDNANVNQIDNVTNVVLKNNANVSYIDKVDELDAYDSTLGDVSIKGAIHLNGNTKSDNLKAYTVIAYPGDKINTVKSQFIGLKPNINDVNAYSEVKDVIADLGADITQAKVDNLKTKDLIFNDSIGKNIDAIYGVDFKNSVVDYLKLAVVKKMSGCKINKFDLTGSSPNLKLYDKVQINEFNIKNDELNLFVFPKRDLGEGTNNYIKRINIDSPEDSYPKIKIQGDIDIDIIEFKNQPGTVDMTKSKNPKKPIKVINGFLNYDAPLSQVPEIDDLDV